MAIDEASRDMIRVAIGSVRASCEARSLRVSWTRPEGWHITLKFFGEMAADRLAAMGAALAAAAREVGRFEVTLRGLIGLPRQARARVLVVGVTDDGTTARLVRAIDVAVAPHGVEREHKEFTPHVTVARIREPGASRVVGEESQPHRDTPFGCVSVKNIGMYESVLGSEGARYRLIEEYPLAAE